MKAVQIHSTQQYCEMKEQKDSFVPVLMSDNCIIIGPAGKEKGSCLGCLVNSLKDNESSYYPLVKGILSGEKKPCSRPEIESERRLISSCKADSDGKVHIINRGSLSVSTFPVYKHPACELCGKEENTDEILKQLRRDYRFGGNYRVRTPEEIMSTGGGYEMLINPHTGIGQYMFRDIDARIIPMYFIKSELAGREFYSYGRTPDLLHSRYAAVFEMLERYSSLVPHTQDCLKGSYNRLTEEGYELIHPRQLVIPEEMLSEAKGYYSDDKEYRWRKVLEINSGSFAYLPEQVIYYDSQLISGEKRFVHETSNGCALGGTLEEAILYAIFELIERDCFLVHWYNRIAPVKLDISNVKNGSISRLVQYMESKGFKVQLFDITMETGIPAIWAAVVDEHYHGKVKCYNAAGAHINPEKALEGALVEAITSIFVYNNILESGKNTELTASLTGSPEKVRDMEDHVYFYANEDNFKYIREFYENEATLDFTQAYAFWYRDKKKEYTFQEILDRVAEFHKKIYISHMFSDINKTLDLECVKVIIPSMLTMTFGNDNKRINYERVQQGPVIAGIRDVPVSAGDVYGLPHPFP